ncbi:MAG: hypothetical protein Q8Q08_08580 [Candidatus Omnitrophota bacterium]|nr:hypothetical protein [Candidatus Omnitrophota bacterium]
MENRGWTLGKYIPQPPGLTKSSPGVERGIGGNHPPSSILHPRFSFHPSIFHLPSSIFIALLLFATPSSANNLRITNVTMEDRTVSGSVTNLKVKFDIAWDNSWRNSTNHDGVWLIVRLIDAANPTCQKNLIASGINPQGTSVGSNQDLELAVSPDTEGALIRRKSQGSGGVSSSGVELTVTDIYGAGCTVSSTTSISAKVVGVEMVFVPTGPFYVGNSTDGTGTEGAFLGYTNLPWYISSEAAIQLTSTSGAYYYVAPPTSNSVNSAERASTGATADIPAAFPKGYQSFYCMKYEVTEGLYVEFLNSLNATQQAARDITTDKGDSVVYRNTVSGSAGGTSTSYSTSRPDRAMSYMSWTDLAAVLDWFALRPMTELEFEKVARGPNAVVPGETVWGVATSYRPLASFDVSPESGNESPGAPADANIRYNDTTLSEGDAFLGAPTLYKKGPVRAGLFARSDSTRNTSGAGYYGAMELSGNVAEYVAYVIALSTDAFWYTGNHGDGDVTTSSTIGFANVAYWPGIDASGYVTKATFSGLRGGSWVETSLEYYLANRTWAAAGSLKRRNNWGGRGVRTCEGAGFCVP